MFTPSVFARLVKNGFSPISICLLFTAKLPATRRLGGFCAHADSEALAASMATSTWVFIAFSPFRFYCSREAHVARGRAQVRYASQKPFATRGPSRPLPTQTGSCTIAPSCTCQPEKTRSPVGRTDFKSAEGRQTSLVGSTPTLFRQPCSSVSRPQHKGQ